MFYFMFTFEFCECCTAQTLMIRAVFRCSSLCSLGYNFVTKVFELVLYSYASNILLQLQTFLEIAFALERIKAFSKSTTTKMKFKKQLIIMLIVAAISAMPNYIIKKSIAAFGVLDNTNQTVYRIVTRDFAQNADDIVNNPNHGLIVYIQRISGSLNIGGQTDEDSSANA